MRLIEMFITGKKMPSLLSELLKYSLERLDIGKMMEEKLMFDGISLSVKNFKGEIVGNHSFGKGKVKLISFGKAAQSMATAVIRIMGSIVSESLVVYPKEQNILLKEDPKVKIIPSTHPVPSELSVNASRKIRTALEGLNQEDTVLFLISGGGSSLVEEPMPPITLEELVKTYSLLLNSGADIKEINTVRKHLSLVKGGRLSQYAYPAQIISFYASDVPGNEISFIASGPTVPDQTTYLDAYNVLKFYGLEDKVPESVLKVIKNGISGELPETPKPGNPVFSRAASYLVATPYELALSLKRKSIELGLNSYIITTRIEGESSEAAKVLSSIALDTKSGLTDFKKPALIIVAGETSVRVRGKGIGGRATELVLWFSKEISGNEGISMFAIDTDGKDGSSDAAGAFADGNTWVELKEIFGSEIIRRLKDNDAFSVLDKGGYTIRTGPTGSNLNNLICILVE
ncbi:MAG: DUF4147 domain-containing protein [Desulfurococcales archaeon]|jgi:glycerate-2-kinase|uniref:Glycerate kinase n=1 Tax=Fervidicoccus fontis TaxID=683846 RepID=A0A7J3SJB7_9CREN|nr:DUF4147 domain-containing protein [Desulfurococcales archaeon]